MVPLKPACQVVDLCIEAGVGTISGQQEEAETTLLLLEITP